MKKPRKAKVTPPKEAKPFVTFLLRAVPSPLWERFKDRAASDGLSARSMLLTLIRDYVERKDR